jgi:enamine deaminase RidA (YjgF/YER057c/UK114 family)
MKPFVPIIPEPFAQIYESYQFAPAVRVGDNVHISGVVGFNEDGNFPPNFTGQACNIFRLLELIMAECGGTLRDVFSMTSYHVGDLPTQMRSMIEEKTRQLGPPHPAWTAVSVCGLAVPEAILEVAAIARLQR